MQIVFANLVGVGRGGVWCWSIYIGLYMHTGRGSVLVFFTCIKLHYDEEA